MALLGGPDGNRKQLHRNLRRKIDFRRPEGDFL